jgi:hypothetical protein
MRALILAICWIASLAGCTVPGAVGPIEVVVPDPFQSAPAPQVEHDVPIMVWCGADPRDANARTYVSNLAASGIDSTMGPCLPYTDYTPAFTGTRYAPPEVYMELVKLNASVGIETLVYDERLWSADPAVQAAAVAFWAPVTRSIEAWDMGDEFDPNGHEWEILRLRWERVIALGTGIRPFTNHLGFAVEQALATFGSAELAFDKYDGDGGVAIAASLTDRVGFLWCAFNTYQHGPYVVTDASIQAMIDALAAHCDGLIAFGGPPLDVADFEEPSLVDDDGRATTWLSAIERSTR